MRKSFVVWKFFGKEKKTFLLELFVKKEKKK
jgi:hypothetical protein